MKKPGILLIGVGKFGMNHFKVLLDMHKKGYIEFVGAITRNPITRTWIESQGIQTYSKLSAKLLRSVQAVDITTPISTHYKITKQCLPYTHVFVEKPLCVRKKEGEELVRLARRYKKILAVGHIFRFNGATSLLRDLVAKEKKLPFYIEGRFTGGAGEPDKDSGIVTSDMHIIDVLDYVLKKKPRTVFCSTWTHIMQYPYEDQALMILQYTKNLSAEIRLGWYRAPKVRSVTFYYEDKEVYVDLLTQVVKILPVKGRPRVVQCYRKQPLWIELLGFVRAVEGKHGNYVSGEIANRIVHIVEKARESIKIKKSVHV